MSTAGSFDAPIEIFGGLDHFLTSLDGVKCGAEAASCSSPAFGGIARDLSQESAAEHTLKVFALEGESGNALSNLRSETGPDVQHVLAVLGPEGGWEKSESAALIAAGFKPVSLGPRTLRLETAAVALVCSIQILWGDMS